MRIYLPMTDIKMNIVMLSDADLTIQRNNAVTILETLRGKNKGWQWHPGVTMWIGHDDLLAKIAHELNQEWIGVNFDVDGIMGIGEKYEKRLKDMGYTRTYSTVLPPLPWWWGHQKFHDSNKAAMLRHDPAWYGELIKNARDDICDWWPRIDKDTWLYGPQPSPDGKFDYIVDGKSIFAEAKKMSHVEFAIHANMYHNLMPDITTPIRPDDPSLDLMMTVHDRFHQVRVYSTHDHR